MKLQQQVTSLELSKRLKELGVKQWSLFYWSIADDRKTMEIRYQTYVSEVNEETVPYYSAFTVAELGEMFPQEYTSQKGLIYGGYWVCGIWNVQEEQELQKARTEADARAKMLIYLLENNLINIKE